MKGHPADRTGPQSSHSPNPPAGLDLTHRSLAMHCRDCGNVVCAGNETVLRPCPRCEEAKGQ